MTLSLFAGRLDCRSRVYCARTRLHSVREGERDRAPEREASKVNALLESAVRVLRTCVRAYLYPKAQSRSIIVILTRAACHARPRTRWIDAEWIYKRCCVVRYKGFDSMFDDRSYGTKRRVQTTNTSNVILHVSFDDFTIVRYYRKNICETQTYCKYVI